MTPKAQIFVQKPNLGQKWIVFSFSSVLFYDVFGNEKSCLFLHSLETRGRGKNSKQNHLFCLISFLSERIATVGDNGPSDKVGK